MENETKKKLFSFRKTEKSDVGPEDTTPTLGFFFKLLWRKLGKLMTLNAMMIPQYVLLVVAMLIFILGRNKVPTMESPLFAPLLGVSLIGQSPSANLLIGFHAQPLELPFLTPGRLIAIAVLVLLTVVTWGWQNIGITYNLRSLVRGDSCFLMSDYFYAIRRNLKQGLLFGILDAVILLVLGVDLFYFNSLSHQSFLFGFLFVMMVSIAVLYLVMRFYIYHMMITFDLSIKKLLKNALIFVSLGIKRNLLALVGIVLTAVLNLLLIMVCLQFNFTLPIILPFFYLPALAAFMAAYAAWPIIQRYMITPYETDTTENEASTSQDDEDVMPVHTEAD